MSHEKDDLRRALEARSAAPSPEFRARLSQALATPPATRDLMPAIALATVFVLTVASVGVLLATRHLGRTNGTAASDARVLAPSPNSSPITTVTSVQMSAPSTNVIWVLVNYDHLYRSTDQGARWEQRPIPADFGVKPAISFVDDQEGYLLAPGSPTTQCQEATAAIWHTTDAGATWHQLVTKGPGQAQCKDGIWFFDTRHGFVAGHDPNHRPTVYRTSDGGSTWAGTMLPDPAYFKSAPGGFTLQVDWIEQFGGAYYLEAYGAQADPTLPHDNQFILRSNDGGASWSYVTKVPSRAVAMVTEARWLDFTAPGQPMESVNGGQQFHQYASNFNTDAPGATQFVFADANVGYAVGNGLLQRTLDGGLRWTRLATPGLAAPSPTPTASSSPIPMPTTEELSAPSANVVWALVANQYLFRSIDQGNTWQQRTLPRLTAGAGATPHISFVDELHGWVLFVFDSPDCANEPASPARTLDQQGAQLFRTTDGATTWTLVDTAVSGQVSPNGLPLEQCKTAFTFVDPQHGFVATSDPASVSVWRTSDGGVTWTATLVPNGHDAPGYRRIIFMQSFGGTLVVYAPIDVFQSTDGGVSWTLVSSWPTPLYFVSPTRWLVIFPASSGETLDAGTTWHDFPTDYHTDSTHSEQFVFATDKVGYGTDPGGVVRTLDGGAHWGLIKTSWP